MQGLRVAVLLAAVCAPAAAADDIEHVFNRLYNFDFPAAHAAVDQSIAAHPDDPFPYAVRAAVDLFYELDRLGILEAEFFADDKRITDKKKLKPDPVVRDHFFKSIEQAQTRAQKILASQPDDSRAFYANCLTLGEMADYMALVEKRHIGSLSVAKRSNACAQQLLKAHPEAYDAYVTVGFTEYLAGSLPFFVRWVIRFDNVEGSKDRGIQILRSVIEKGHYLKGFAKVLLALAYLREKKPDQSEKLLVELSQEYPENPLFRKELAKLSNRQRGPVTSAP